MVLSALFPHAGLGLTLFIQMEYPIHIDATSMELPIFVIEAVTAGKKFCKIIYFSFFEDCFNLSKQCKF